MVYLDPIKSSIFEIAETPNLSGEFFERAARSSCSVLPLRTKALSLAFEEIVHEFLTPKDRAILDTYQRGLVVHHAA